MIELKIICRFFDFLANSSSVQIKMKYLTVKNDIKTRIKCYENKLL